MGSYIIKEGIKNVFKNKKSTLISLVMIVCTMFLFGVFFSIGENVEYLLDQIQKKHGIEVFIYDTTDEVILDMENQIKALDGVNTVVYKNKQQALDSFKEQLKDNKELLDGYEGENNIFPASFLVTLTDLKKKDTVKNEITNIGEEIAKKYSQTYENKEGKNTMIDTITDKEKTIAMLIVVVQGVRIFLGSIFVILLLFSVTIISNTIKLTVYVRRKEISIMKYVGATNGFIRWPFIVEGIIIGFFASILTFLIVFSIYDIVINKIETTVLLQRLNLGLLPFVDFAPIIAIFYGVLGIGVGVIGSSISMKKYLEV